MEGAMMICRVCNTTSMARSRESQKQIFGHSARPPPDFAWLLLRFVFRKSAKDAIFRFCLKLGISSSREEILAQLKPRWSYLLVNRLIRAHSCYWQSSRFDLVVLVCPSSTADQVSFYCTSRYRRRHNAMILSFEKGVPQRMLKRFCGCSGRILDWTSY